MKKTNLVLGFMLIMLLAMSANLMAATLYVGSGQTYSTITLAIAAAGDGIGDIISVEDAEHTEQGITVNKSLTIQGYGASNTIVQAHATQGSATDRVFHINSGKTVTIKDMTIRHGSLTGFGGDGGGGIYNDGTLTLTNCTVSRNSAEGIFGGDGGGICGDSDSIVTLTNCTVSGNSANGSGGGIYTWYGTVTLTNCTVSGNSASYTGGGIRNYSGPVTLTNCTVSGNSTGGNGGGISSYDTIHIKNTILANNSATGNGDDFYKSGGTVIDRGYNIVEYSYGHTFIATTDITGNQPNLNLRSTLEDNGTLNGTKTLALYYNVDVASVAIDAGGDASTGTNNGIAVPSTDQRGAERYDFTSEENVQSSTDIGAYEDWPGGDDTLPVELSSFTAQYINDTPTLCWTTQSETSNAGWNIYRSQTDILEQAMQINFEMIPGAGTTSEPTEYIYEDESELMENTEYWYWLESIDYSGLTDSYGPISLIIPEEGEEPGSPEIPGIYGLHQNYPNPFNPNTEISFMMKESCIAELSIYNVKGEKVKTIFTNKSISRDELLISNWNGKDESGKEVSTGIYYYQLRTTKGNFIRKMILLK